MRGPGIEGLSGEDDNEETTARVAGPDPDSELHERLAIAGEELRGLVERTRPAGERLFEDVGRTRAEALIVVQGRPSDDRVAGDPDRVSEADQRLTVAGLELGCLAERPGPAAAPHRHRNS